MTHALDTTTLRVAADGAQQRVVRIEHRDSRSRVRPCHRERAQVVVTDEQDGAVVSAEQRESVEPSRDRGRALVQVSTNGGRQLRADAA